MPDPHTGFVATAFALGLIVIGGMALGILLDHRRLRRDLDRLARELPAGTADEAERP